jgi:hypothetical protein
MVDVKPNIVPKVVDLKVDFCIHFTIENSYFTK